MQVTLLLTENTVYPIV